MIDKEDIYDEQINPLMAEILRICKENGIPMVASFQLTDSPKPESSDGDTDEAEGPLFCSSAILPDNGWTDDKLKMAHAVLRRGWIAEPPFTAFSITTKQNS